MIDFKNIKAIAFDFWGVFAEMNPPMYEYMKQHNILLEKYSEKIHELIVAYDLNNLTEQQFLKECSKIIGLEIPYPLCRYIYHEDVLNENLIAVVKKLKERFKIALLSNNNKEYCEEYLFRPGLDKFFDIMVISYQVGYRKPAPEIYQILIKKLNLRPEEILFVDDDPTKLPAAEAQGIKTLVYKCGETDRILLSL